ncbi:hypothetical protein RND81_01G008400 [Saponaria officinalis]|uniref:Uncharacterized protein n=1 Tax=Saponaria officinalis TaxID=3572 RepID=A0AAW1NF67_SAPOF
MLLRIVMLITCLDQRNKTEPLCFVRIFPHYFVYMYYVAGSRRSS